MLAVKLKKITQQKKRYLIATPACLLIKLLTKHTRYLQLRIVQLSIKISLCGKLRVLKFIEVLTHCKSVQCPD